MYTHVSKSKNDKIKIRRTMKKIEIIKKEKPLRGKGCIKENDRGGEFNYDILQELL
jgi:hypothetical protein